MIIFLSYCIKYIKDSSCIISSYSFLSTALLSKSICNLVEINFRSCPFQFPFLSKSIIVVVETNFCYCRKPFLQQFTDFIYTLFLFQTVYQWVTQDFQKVKPSPGLGSCLIKPIIRCHIFLIFRYNQTKDRQTDIHNKGTLGPLVLNTLKLSSGFQMLCSRR